MEVREVAQDGQNQGLPREHTGRLAPPGQHSRPQQGDGPWGDKEAASCTSHASSPPLGATPEMDQDAVHSGAGRALETT